MRSAVSADERTGLPSALMSRVAYSPSAGWMELTTSSVGSVTAVRGRRMEEVVEGNSLPVVLSSRRVTKGGQPQGRRRKRRRSTSRRVSPPLLILLPHLPQLPKRTSRGSWLSPRRRVRDLPNSPAETTRLSRRRRPPSETDFMIHGRDRSTLSCEEALETHYYYYFCCMSRQLVIYIVCMLVMLLTLHLSTPTALSRNRE